MISLTLWSTEFTDKLSNDNDSEQHLNHLEQVFNRFLDAKHIQVLAFHHFVCWSLFRCEQGHLYLIVENVFTFSFGYV
jgi:hypothetical protein